jgi:hypothetical protein
MRCGSKIAFRTISRTSITQPRNGPPTSDQTITRCIPEGEGTAASYLEHRRDRPSERLDVKRERLLRRLREGQHKTASFARVRPHTYAKPWGRESRHSLRKKALSRAMLVNEIARAGDGVEPTPYSGKLGAVLWGV